MGTLKIDSSSAQVEVAVSSEQLYSGPIVHGALAQPNGQAYFLASTTLAEISVDPQASRLAIVERPTPHASLAHSNVVRALIVGASLTYQKRGFGMDKIPTATIGQGQRVTLTAYVEDSAGTAVTQAAVQAVHANVFEPSVTGGTPVLEELPTVASTIYDTTQTALDPDGYNVAYEFKLDEDDLAKGGSVYELEVVLEMKTGELIPVRGRVAVEANLSYPINAY